MTTDPWRDLASALAATPALFQRLLAEHVPNGNGRCRACTTPGYGTPHVRVAVPDP